MRHEDKVTKGLRDTGKRRRKWWLFVSWSLSLSVGVPVAHARTYTTTFPLTENPISEGGNWMNGKVVGLDWSDVQTTPGFAFGAGPMSGGYDDPTAVVTGAWGPNQTVQATVHSINQSSSVYDENELRLRTTITPHSITGYEINNRCLKGQSGSYLAIVRWNGPFGDFTTLVAYSGAQYGVGDGDVVKATMIGNVITVYVNGTQMGTATDSTFTTGNPGIGLDGPLSTTRNHGFTSFSATDGGGASPCDLNQDGTVNVADVQREVTQALGVTSCTSDLNKDGVCNVVDVQRVVVAALGGQCVAQ